MDRVSFVIRSSASVYAEARSCRVWALRDQGSGFRSYELAFGV